MPIGPSSRPQEPLRVFAMLLALTLAAFAGGALGVVWHWLAGDEVAKDQIEAVSEPEESATPPPEPRETIAPPAPSPNP